MTYISTDFDWEAPVPQIFTRTDRRCFWPSDRLYRPLLFATRYARDLKAVTQGLPPILTPILRERFKPTRGPMRWLVPPAMPISMRQRFAPEELYTSSEKLLCSHAGIASAMIERLLDTEEGLVTGLTHNYLLIMQIIRLRQVWEEMQRRDWPEGPLAAFTRALG